MRVHNIVAVVPVTLTVATSTDPNKMKFEIDLSSEDTCTKICHSIAETLDTNGTVLLHPTVWMCIQNSKLFLEIYKNVVYYLYTNIPIQGEQIYCNVQFLARCNFPPNEDVAIDKLEAVAIKSVA